MGKKQQNFREYFQELGLFTLIAVFIPGLAIIFGEILVNGGNKYFESSWFIRIPVLILIGFILKTSGIKEKIKNHW